MDINRHKLGPAHRNKQGRLNLGVEKPKWELKEPVEGEGAKGLWGESCGVSDPEKGSKL